MNNFGVVEVASERRSVAPGWAYVPDMPAGYSAAAAAAAAAAATATAASAKSNNRKRAARHQGGRTSVADLSSRQEAKMRKELEVLDRDGGAGVGGGGGRHAFIPVPAKAVKAPSKHTANVRKILTSQKTFANHLDDFNALAALNENTHAHNHGHAHNGSSSNNNNNHNSNASHRHGTPDSTATPRRAAAEAAAAATSHSRAGSKRNAKKDTKKDAKKDKRKHPTGRAARLASMSASASASAADTPMPDAPPTDDGKGAAAQTTDAAADGAAAAAATTTSSSILRPYAGPHPPSHPLDADPLLVSYMPPLPSDDELRALLARPPLTYAEARASWGTEPSSEPGETGETDSSRALVKRYPGRTFCEVCGYWGRVKCTKCGTPVCALGCLEVHREECITRYGL